MSCEWSDKIEPYLDNELSEADDRDLSQHLATCHACATAAFDSRKLKLSIKRAASATFVPSAEFRTKIYRSVAARPKSPWFAFALAAATLLLAFVALGPWMHFPAPDVLAEATDLHVSALASANPVDVISTDRHTVKPWFEGKLPFTFDIPDLQNSEFHLTGGRMAYIAQSPAAQLLFAIRKHEVSVFILQERKNFALSSGSQASEEFNFNLQTWTDHGLRYIVVSDTNRNDVESLAKLLQSSR